MPCVSGVAVGLSLCATVGVAGLRSVRAWALGRWRVAAGRGPAARPASAAVWRVWRGVRDRESLVRAARRKNQIIRSVVLAVSRQSERISVHPGSHCRYDPLRPPGYVTAGSRIRSGVSALLAIPLRRRAQQKGGADKSGAPFHRSSKRSMRPSAATLRTTVLLTERKPK